MKVDSSRYEEDVFSMQEFEDEELKKLVTLKARNKVQERISENLTLDNRDLKRLLHILEEREYAFKKEKSDLKNQLEMARKTEEEIGNQLKEHINNCRKLVAELQERRSKVATDEKTKVENSSSNEVIYHQNQEANIRTRRSMKNVRCFNYQEFGHFYANCRSKITKLS